MKVWAAPCVGRPSSLYDRQDVWQGGRRKNHLSDYLVAEQKAELNYYLTGDGESFCREWKTEPLLQKENQTALLDQVLEHFNLQLPKGSVVIHTTNLPQFYIEISCNVITVLVWVKTLWTTVGGRISRHFFY